MTTKPSSQPFFPFKKGAAILFPIFIKSTVQGNKIANKIKSNDAAKVILSLQYRTIQHMQSSELSRINH